MVFSARATRGHGLPSLGLMARLGVPVGGRVSEKVARSGRPNRPPSCETKRASSEGACISPDARNRGWNQAALEVKSGIGVRFPEEGIEAK